MIEEELAQDAISAACVLCREGGHPKWGKWEEGMCETCPLWAHSPYNMA